MANAPEKYFEISLRDVALTFSPTGNMAGDKRFVPQLAPHSYPALRNKLSFEKP